MSQIWRYFWFVPEARKDGQSGIFLEPAIRQSELAEEKHRTAVGLDAPRMNAVLAESGLGMGWRIFRRGAHRFRITARLSPTFAVTRCALKAKFGTVDGHFFQQHDAESGTPSGQPAGPS